MSANTNIGSTPVNQGYVQLIHTGETGGIDGTLRTLYDGDGTASDLQIASNAVKISTQLYIGSQTILEYIQEAVKDILVTNASHTNITATQDAGDKSIDLNASGEVTLTGTQTLTNKTLASPTFSGDIDFTDASTPTFTITDTTNSVTASFVAADSSSVIGTTSSHNFGIKAHNARKMIFESTAAIVNDISADYDFRIKDSSGANLFSTDAANSRVGILDSTPSYTLDVNGTGRFTGAVQLDDNLTVTGDLQVNGTTTTVNQTNLDVSDNIIGLNRGASSNANDSGLIIERGSTGDNAAIIWDESADKFTLGTTTSTPSATGNLTISTGTLVANVEGNITSSSASITGGSITGITDLAIADGGTGASNAGNARINLGLGTLAELNSIQVANFLASAITTSSEAFADNDTTVMTSAAINDRIESFGYGVGDMTGVNITASNPLDISQSNTTSGDYSATISLDATEFQGYLTDMTDLIAGFDELLVIDSSDTTLKRKAINEIRLTAFDDTGFSSGISFNGSTANGLLTYGNSTTADVESNLTFDGTNLDLPDSKKIRFGTGNDLEIYHDGTDDIINTKGNAFKLLDNGTERLRVTAAGHIIINENGNDQNFRVEGDTDANLLFVDAGTDRIGIGTNSPASPLHISNSTDELLKLTSTGANSEIRFSPNTSTFDVRIGATASSANSEFYVETAGTKRLYVDNSGNVGIGTTSPGYKLDVSGQGKVTNGWLVDNGTTAGFFTTDSDNVNFGSSTSGKGLRLFSANAEKMRIDSSGNVLIGGTSASGHGFNLEVLNDHAYVKGPDGWNGTGDKAIVALGSGVSNESFGCGYVYGTGLVLSTYKLSGGGDFGSSTQNSLVIADTTGQASFINDVIAYASSDKRLKENIKPLDNALDKIKKINGVEFDWIDGKDEHGNSVHSNEGHDVGVIAQEIEEVLPEVVHTRDNGYKAVKYEKIVPLLIQAIKEQQQQIEELKNG